MLRQESALQKNYNNITTSSCHCGHFHIWSVKRSWKSLSNDGNRQLKRLTEVSFIFYWQMEVVSGNVYTENFQAMSSSLMHSFVTVHQNITVRRNVYNILTKWSHLLLMAYIKCSKQFRTAETHRRQHVILQCLTWHIQLGKKENNNHVNMYKHSTSTLKH